MDYMTAVGIAGGNWRVTVRYAPLMLQGSARSWLNSLPGNSINCWQDFDDAFVHNFTGTYERPSLPRHLALCVQGKDEPLRDYLAWWIKLRNTCEGVHAIQAIQYFTDGCLDGSMLKHKLPLLGNWPSVAHVFMLSVAHMGCATESSPLKYDFCGACALCATEISSFCGACRAHAPQKYDISVAHVATMRHRIMCAT